jgi:hypothetical protein
VSSYTRLIDWCERIGDDYVTTRAIRWQIGRVGSGHIYTVWPGYRFDVSIPWWARLVFDPHDARYLKAACLHDHMLEAGWDRVTAGAIFHQALRADGVPAWRRLAMWLAVSVYRFQ